MTIKRDSSLLEKASGRPLAVTKHSSRIGGSLEINLHTLVESFGYARPLEIIEKDMQSSCTSGITSLTNLIFHIFCLEICISNVDFPCLSALREGL